MNDIEKEDFMSSTLVVYYSMTGTTKKLAESLASGLDADLFAINVAPNTFPSDMFATADLAKKQKAEKSLPKLTSPIPDLTGYDVIIVAGPNWSAQVSTPVLNFLEQIQGFAGRVISLNTSVGQNDNQYNDDFKKQAKRLNVVATFNNDPDAVVQFFK